MSELVLVSTVIMFRHNYVVEVPDGKTEWALDTVVMEESKEFSQKFIDESIIDYRVIDKDELRKIWNQDDYTWKEAPDSTVYSYVTKLDNDGNIVV